MSKARWVERHQNINDFVKLHGMIRIALSVLTDKDSIAAVYLTSLDSTSIFVRLKILNIISTLLLPLNLQSKKTRSHSC